ncbi:MAG: RrF2 family transcriptional regulator [Planctomycetota bacterium]|jgi:Rrf2 family protein
MISLSHTTGYAILALGCIGSWNGDWVLSNQIHKCTGVPMPYLRKVLFALGKAVLINAKRGYSGGFVLARPPEEISLLDVVKAVESRNQSHDCLLALAGCSDDTPCPVRGFWQKEKARIEAYLDRITVAKAAEHIRAARWGKLTECPPEGYTAKRPTRDGAGGPQRRKTAPTASKRKKARTKPRSSR